MSWYRRFFSSTPKPNFSGTLTKAEQGDAEAQFALGLKYGNSQGASQDFGQAAHWYRKAAEQNHSLAQFNLGVMLAKGQGVPQDDAEAVIWIRRAAEQGDAGAQFSLGMRCHRDSVNPLQTDVAESRIEAYKWFSLAAAQGYQGSVTACERLTLGMTGDEVAAGNQRAHHFISGKPAGPAAE
jgi:hypothetical protein